MLDTKPRPDSTNAEDPRDPAMRVVTYTTLYPNEVRPNHGIFVENRLRKLTADGASRPESLHRSRGFRLLPTGSVTTAVSPECRRANRDMISKSIIRAIQRFRKSA